MVSLVTSPDVEYLSMLEKEKVWIFLYIQDLRFIASPAAALAANTPPPTPAASPMIARISILPPVPSMTSIFPASTPSSMISAIRRGIIISMRTSSIIHAGVAMEAGANCFTCEPMVFRHSPTGMLSYVFFCFISSSMTVADRDLSVYPPRSVRSIRYIEICIKSGALLIDRTQ